MHSVHQPTPHACKEVFFLVFMKMGWETPTTMQRRDSFTKKTKQPHAPYLFSLSRTPPRQMWTEAEVLPVLAGAMVLTALPTFYALVVGVKAPYGRYYLDGGSKYGFHVNGKVAWIFQVSGNGRGRGLVL